MAILNGKFRKGDWVQTEYGMGKVLGDRSNPELGLRPDNNDYAVEVPGAGFGKATMALNAEDMQMRWSSKRPYTDTELANGANGIFG